GAGALRGGNRWTARPARLRGKRMARSAGAVALLVSGADAGRGTQGAPLADLEVGRRLWADTGASPYPAAAGNPASACAGLDRARRPGGDRLTGPPARRRRRRCVPAPGLSSVERAYGRRTDNGRVRLGEYAGRRSARRP